MKNIDDEIQRIRRKNLEILIQEAGSQAELGNKIDVDSSYISQMNTGHRPIREKISRKLESIMARPLNWMDREHIGHTAEQSGTNYTYKREKDSKLTVSHSDQELTRFDLDDVPKCGEDYLVRIPAKMMPGYPEGGVFRVTDWSNDPSLVYLILRLKNGNPVLMMAMEHRDVLGATVTDFAPLVLGKVEKDPDKWCKKEQVEVLGAILNPVEDPRFRQK